MTHRLLVAATLMLVTTATAWAETEGVPNVKTPDPEKVETQIGETLEDIQSYSVEQKNQAMRVARHAMDDLNHQVTLMQGDIKSQWKELSQETRLQKQDALASLKEQQAALESHYQALQSASEDNWEAAKVKFQRSWEAAKQGWQSLTAPSPAQEQAPQ
ncbi:hypothetical protein [Alcanivorax sp.]|uniref:hypothetical protein n=1 Tax=Alcanivorax sp. TaxID=1872427 RepID=UPI0032D923AE